MIKSFKEEKECFYRNEKYLVRDNGAVFRCSRNEKKVRSLDNKWTFGKIGRNGYLYISNVPVHRIVAFAFLEKPGNDHLIVDHKDTNRQNNRPENLEWKTKEENILGNPNTLSKIEYITGQKITSSNIKEVLKLLPDLQHKSYNWMHPVTPEESENLKNRQLYWLKNKGKKVRQSNGEMGEWVFSPHLAEKGVSDYMEQDAVFCESLTKNALQNQQWRTQKMYLCCPAENEEQSLSQYFKNLKKGKVFSESKYGVDKIKDFGFSPNKSKLFVEIYAENNPIRPWFLCEISIQNHKFCHDGSSYFEEDGADKYFLLAVGKKWEGGEVFDDYAS